ncbi:TIGR03767 family metallophosphoesterase [Streptomyces sp. NPDC004610]|uniref:TIGR03767 family metallophosphoesterase n=1 Tax=unclassified Streptomyces TaxID=2593676 RepID=UPI0033A134F4
MPRTRSVAETAAEGGLALNRRAVLATAGAVTLSAGIGHALRPTDSQAAPAAPAAAAPATSAAAPAPYTRATTLVSVAAPRAGSGYRRLGDGPGWRRVLRTDLAAAKSGRADRRTPLAAFVQVTDLHLLDVQHPLRLEFLRSADVRAWRPQEALTVQGAVSLVERINALRAAPVTGAPLGFAITTGDNTDNNCRTELDWFLTVMSGGRITPDSGDPHRHEGVMNSGLTGYWQPDAPVRDADKQRGFPHLEGFLAAARREVNSPGLNLPWYSTVGNHDSLPLGCYGHGDPYLRDFATGGRKLMSLPAAESKKLQDAIRKAKDPIGTQFRDLLKAHARELRPVTPDPRRAPFTATEYLTAHLDPKYTGMGPVGHGYSTANIEAGTQYYSFRIADDIIGVSLDTTDAGGHYEGSLGTAQLNWLDRTLTEHSDAYAIIFSHHTSDSMDNPRPDPARPGERRHNGAEVVALLNRHRNVLAWVNGHIHRNAVTARPGPDGRSSFWEISTASHIDFPHHARIVELTDNKDGTISLFTTLVESAAPHRTDFTDLSQTGLAALYRELSFNAPGGRTDLSGGARDRNTELVLRKT